MTGTKDSDRNIALRIIDANANRCAEGLRVIEELARFAMEKRTLVEELKEIRHEVRQRAAALGSELIESRNISRDVGKDFSTSSELSRSRLGDIAGAGFSRVEEALRVIEEFSKLIDADVSVRFKELRFRLYRLEKVFFNKVQSTRRLPSCPFLYAVLDRSVVGAADLEDTAQALVEGGVGMIQYRAKGISRLEMERDLILLLKKAQERGVPVIVNDFPVMALEVGADGVHLGASDPSVSQARSILGGDAIIGVSVHAKNEFDESLKSDADYVSIGAIYPSKTKPTVTPQGTDKLRRYVEMSTKPVIAIGGIDRNNLPDVLSTGVCAVAAVRALLEGDVKKNCEAFINVIDTIKKMG